MYGVLYPLWNGSDLIMSGKGKTGNDHACELYGLTDNESLLIMPCNYPCARFGVDAGYP